MRKWRDIETSKVHRLFYPQVPVVVTVEFEGQIGGMPAIWCTPLSFDPPLIGVALAPDHQTFKMLMGARTFGINWLEYGYAKELARLGETSAKGLTNKLTSVGLKTFKGKKTAQPLIEQSSANLECRLNQNYRVGTHELIVGEVLSASARSSFDKYWNFTRYNPILYAGTTENKRKAWIFMSIRGKKTKIPYTHAD